MKKNNYLYELFYFLSISLIILSVLEIIFNNFVLVYFNLNILLFFWLVNFLLILCYNSKYEVK